MKTKFLTLSVDGLVTIPLNPAKTEFTVEELSQWENDLLKTIQDAVGVRGVLFEGEVRVLTNLPTDVSSLNTEAVNDAVNALEGLPPNKPMKRAGSTAQLKPVKRNPMKGKHYPKTGKKMHWKTRAKLRREGKLK